MVGWAVKVPGYGEETKLGPTTVGNLTEHWSLGPNRSGPPYPATEPAVAGSKAFLTLSDGRLLAVQTSTGKIAWSYPLSCTGAAPSPLVSGGIAYFDGCDGNLYALNEQTGALVWQEPVSPTGPPVLGGGMLFVTSGSTIVALNPATGATIWTYADTAKLPVSGASGGALTYSDGRLYFAAEVPNTTGGSAAVAVHAKTGTVAWRTKYTLASWNTYSTSQITIVGQSAYVWVMQGSAAGTLYSMSTLGGQLNWSISSSWFAGPIAVAKGAIYGIFNSNVYAINAADGSTIWQIPDTAGDGTTVANGVVYFTNSDSEMEAASTATGAVLWTGPAHSSPPDTTATIANGQLLYEDWGGAYDFHLPG
jgi:outer membrane protein assembly factor BamB